MNPKIEVFELDYDVNRYQALLVDGSLDGVPRLNGKPLSDSWTPPALYSDKPLLAEPLLWYTIVLGACFAIREASRDLLELYLTIAGELLPANVEGEPFLIENVTAVINCLDRDNTVRKTPGWSTGTSSMPTASRARRSSGSRRCRARSSAGKTTRLPRSPSRHESKPFPTPGSPSKSSGTRSTGGSPETTASAREQWATRPLNRAAGAAASAPGTTQPLPRRLGPGRRPPAPGGPVRAGTRPRCPTPW